MPFFLLSIVFDRGATAPSGTEPLHYRGFTVTLRHATLGGTPLDECSSSRRDLYLHNTQHSLRDIHAPAGFEPAIPESGRAQTHASEGAATAIGFDCT
jgi:hypothetical protein